MEEGKSLAKASGIGLGLGWAGIIVGAFVCPPVAIAGAWVAIASMGGVAIAAAKQSGRNERDEETRIEESKRRSDEEATEIERLRAELRRMDPSQGFWSKGLDFDLRHLRGISDGYERTRALERLREEIRKGPQRQP